MTKFHQIAAGMDDLAGKSSSLPVRDRFPHTANAHIHLPPNFSAFASVEQAVSLADAQGLAVLGASNYYDYSVYDDFAEEAATRKIFPLFGIEIIAMDEKLRDQGIRINDPGNPGKFYICGKGIARFEPMPEAAARLLQPIRDNDSARIDQVIHELNLVMSRAGLLTELTGNQIKRALVERYGSSLSSVYLQERHVGQAFQEAIFEQIPSSSRMGFFEALYGAAPKAELDNAVAVQNEIRSQLMKAGRQAFVAETFVSFQHAYDLILALGGIPCYPVLADGASPVCEFEASPEDLASELKARGIWCAEMIPGRNSLPILSEYVHALRDAGLFVTAGTEHNTLDLLPMVPACAGDVAIPDDLSEIFWEGACVVAAHQYLTARGDTGYIDSEGNKSSEFADDGGRLEFFSTLGAAVIEEYRLTCS